MYYYIFGFALLFGGYVTFAKSMGPLDNTSDLVGIRFIGGGSSTVLFFCGFFIFNWWAPLAGILLAMFLWMFINTIALKSQSFRLLFAMRSHIGMMVGIIFCLYSFFTK